MIEPILSLEGGAHLPAPLRSALGRPNWSLGQLLGDLELRLGLVPHAVPHGERVQRYAARLRHVAARDPAAFFARSLQADELGTASALLRQRDELCLAGWGGPTAPNAHTPQPAPHHYATTGAPRPDALAAAEAAGPTDEIASTPDRLARVHAALPDLPRSPYPRVHLLDEPMDLPAAWRALLKALELRGTELASLVDSRFAHDGDPDLPPGDLAELRRAVHCSATPRALRGDGTMARSSSTGKRAGHRTFKQANLILTPPSDLALTPRPVPRTYSVPPLRIRSVSAFKLFTRVMTAIDANQELSAGNQGASYARPKVAKHSAQPIYCRGALKWPPPYRHMMNPTYSATCAGNPQAGSAPKVKRSTSVRTSPPSGARKPYVERTDEGATSKRRLSSARR